MLICTTRNVLKLWRVLAHRLQGLGYPLLGKDIAVLMCLLGERTAHDRVTTYSDRALALLVVLVWGRHVPEHMYALDHSTSIRVDISLLNGVGNILNVIASSSMFHYG